MSGPTASDIEASRPPQPLVSRGFGLPMGIFVVVSSMIGVGVLTTSGFTVASVGSNELDAVSLGGWWHHYALRGALRGGAGGRPPVVGRRLHLPVRSVRPTRGVSYRVGLVSDRFRRANRCVGVRLCDLPAGSAWPASHDGEAGPSGIGERGHRVLRLDPHLEGESRDPGSRDRHITQAGYPVHISGRRIVCRLGTLGEPGRPAVGEPQYRAAMLFSLVYISYAYTGWNAASYIAGEIAEPGRRLPQAILIGTSLVVALYLGLNTVYSLALPAGEIQRIAKEQGFDAVAPIAELAAKRLFGSTITATLSVAFGLTSACFIERLRFDRSASGCCHGSGRALPGDRRPAVPPHRSPRRRDCVAGGLGPDAALVGNLREDLDLCERGTGPLLDAVGEHGHGVAAYPGLTCIVPSEPPATRSFRPFS